MKKNNKILICGLGSIGQRHALNLIDLGYKDLVFLREKEINKLNKKLNNYPIVNKISEAIKERPIAALICNTSNRHLTTAIKLAQKIASLIWLVI